MPQKTVGTLQELTEEAPDIQDIAWPINTTITEVFCEYPATFPPDVSIGKHPEEKSPTGSMTSLMLLSSKCIQGTYNSWNMVKCGLIQGNFFTNLP